MCGGLQVHLQEQWRVDELVRSREPLARLPGARKAQLLDPAVDITAPGTLCRSCAARVQARRHLVYGTHCGRLRAVSAHA